ncbi:hypothetical protein B296_00033798 [Ensete ventricosum]|uniref:Uncharacterized protein n=1 Tax=Ensete ventricosum TaxID=4639 RepID=A0A426YIE4_ENSVE|nr:hypothetical protein B296_00033798 [Ensete ventricosum]
MQGSPYRSILAYRDLAGMICRYSSVCLGCTKRVCNGFRLLQGSVTVAFDRYKVCSSYCSDFDHYRVCSSYRSVQGGPHTGKPSERYVPAVQDGTPEWMAPELIRNEPFTEKFANEGTRLEIPEGPLRKLISDCWAVPHERPSCQEILTRLLDCEYTVS